ncbi:TolC family protein [uncultured Bacteroides sp.]|uniref:TolC family protein n=1 Tax=uncultured Bacteroides sp. TaxID=162156 RepID=UPI002AA8975F|nr:TolC family protein [uncultured Bacteroides sp.]
MKNKNLKRFLSGGLVLMLTILAGHAQQADSLSHYLETAARNNPLINADFASYKASVEKVTQAGAYPDPELEIGFFLKPMEVVNGKQLANFTLMQMFPWFGTRGAARSEATQMTKMAYEKFRESRNELYYQVKSQWYQLSNLREQWKNTQAHLVLLNQLEQLALTRFSSPAGGRGSSQQGFSSAAQQPAAVAGGGGQSMGGMGGAPQSGSAPAAASSMNSMPTSSMSGGSSSSLSDVLRIQLEKKELENKLETILSDTKAAEARFNALLNRSQQLPVTVPDSLQRVLFAANDRALLDTITTQNPMLAMLEAEGNAYEAKRVMDKRMSYPMLGIGLQYSLIGQKTLTADNMGSMSGMNGNDMIMPMVKITLPIFRRKYNAQQRESRYNSQSSRMKYDDTLNKLQAEYIGLKQQLEDASRKVTLYEEQYTLSQSIYRVMVQGFSAGSTSLTDVIAVERQMLDYTLRESEAIASYNTVVAGIDKLVSTSF